MCSNAAGARAPATYLIMVRDSIVSKDIAETIADFEVTARVLEATGPDRALRALETVQRLAVAFVEIAPRTFAGSELAAAIAARSGRVIFLGDAAEEEPASSAYLVLQRPFSSDVLLRYLSTAGSH